MEFRSWTFFFPNQWSWDFGIRRQENTTHSLPCQYRAYCMRVNSGVQSLPQVLNERAWASYWTTLGFEFFPFIKWEQQQYLPHRLLWGVNELEPVENLKQCQADNRCCVSAATMIWSLYPARWRYTWPYEHWCQVYLSLLWTLPLTALLTVNTLLNFSKNSSQPQPRNYNST